MNYETYQLEDYLGDESFIHWVMNPLSEDSQGWQKWVEAHPEKSGLISLAKDTLLSVQYKNRSVPSVEDMDEVWLKIKNGKQSRRSSFRISALHFTGWVRYAAVLLAVSGLSWLSWKYLQKGDVILQPVPRITASTIQQKTDKGDKRNVQLPDGSRVLLNSDSRITYSEDYGDTDRRIVLDGEAFFEVMPDAARPFIIRTGKLETIVVGTSFNISAYKGNPDIKVAVVTGKVRVKAHLDAEGVKEVVLFPSQMLTYGQADGEFKKENTDLVTETSWKKNVFFLKNADFQEIKDKLERWYSVTFVVDEGLDVKEDFTARFGDVPLEQVLDALNYTSRFQYERINDKVYVKKKHP